MVVGWVCFCGYKQTAPGGPSCPHIHHLGADQPKINGAFCLSQPRLWRVPGLLPMADPLCVTEVGRLLWGEYTQYSQHGDCTVTDHSQSQRHDGEPITATATTFFRTVSPVRSKRYIVQIQSYIVSPSLFFFLSPY